MKTTIKNILMGGTVLLASTIAMTTLSSAADGKSKRNSGKVGIQSVLPKAPTAKIRNRSREARKRLRNRKRLKIVRPKAPGSQNRRIARPKAPTANQDRPRQIKVIPRVDERGLATETGGNKQLFSVLPKAPSAKKPSGTKIVDARPNIDPELIKPRKIEVIEAPAKLAGGTPDKEVVKPEPKIEKKVEEKAEDKVEKKVEEKAKPKPKKEKKVAKKRKLRIDGEVYVFNEDTGHYESQTRFYDEDHYYETEPSYNHGYHGGGSYYGGSSYGGYYSGSSYGGSGGYNCNKY